MLRAFAAVVDNGSFTAAASALRVKQSTVSKWMAALEDELGVALLDRTTRSLRVTDAGLRFHARVQDVVSAYETAVTEARGDSAILSGTIRVSLPVVFGRLFVVPLLARLLRQHEGLELDLVFSDRYVRLVDEGFDVALRVGTAVDSTLRAHVLGGSSRRLVASPGYVRGHGAPERVAELAYHECLVLASAQGRDAWRFKAAGRTHRVTPRGRVRTNNSEAALTLARGGMGVALLAAWLVDADIRAGRLVQLLPDFEAPRAPIHALTAPGKRVPARVVALLEHLRAGLQAPPNV